MNLFTKCKIENTFVKGRWYRKKRGVMKENSASDWHCGDGGLFAV
jgi:hypothetical protein